MWLIGGLAGFGILWGEIGSLREEVRENRIAITELAKGPGPDRGDPGRAAARVTARLSRQWHSDRLAPQPVFFGDRQDADME